MKKIYVEKKKKKKKKKNLDSFQLSHVAYFGVSMLGNTKIIEGVAHTNEMSIVGSY